MYYFIRLTALYIYNTMKLYKDYIFKHIEETKFPLWGLYLVQGYKRVPIMFYAGDNFTESDMPEEKAKKKSRPVPLLSVKETE